MSPCRRRCVWASIRPGRSQAFPRSMTLIPGACNSGRRTDLRDAVALDEHRKPVAGRVRAAVDQVRGFDQDALGRAAPPRSSRAVLGEEEQECDEHGAARWHGARAPRNAVEPVLAPGLRHHVERRRGSGSRSRCARNYRVSPGNAYAGGEPDRATRHCPCGPGPQEAAPLRQKLRSTRAASGTRIPPASFASTRTLNIWFAAGVEFETVTTSRGSAMWSSPELA